MKKALVLCGGIPQVALINELKSRGIYTVLADMNEKVPGRAVADRFLPVSVFDIEAIKVAAREENVDIVITACADQVLEVTAEVSEALGLPCYLDLETAKKVSDKSLMKRVFLDCGIPTSKYAIVDEVGSLDLEGLQFPLIVKPVDAYSSKGVRKVYQSEEVCDAIDDARAISRSGKVVVEEFVEGAELSVDVYVEHGIAKILCVSCLEKIPADGQFVICRTKYPAAVSEKLCVQITTVAQQIADAFGLVNSPMLIQMITDGKEVSVVEFCARTGGGDKFSLIERATGFDVIAAVVDLTLGEVPHYESLSKDRMVLVSEYLYAEECTLGVIDGAEELVSRGIVDEFHQLKSPGSHINSPNSSSDRVAYFTIVDDDIDSLEHRHSMASSAIKVLDANGNEKIRRDIMRGFSFRKLI